jgi:transcriptional regulator with XRE-family HTH domain
MIGGFMAWPVFRAQIRTQKIMIACLNTHMARIKKAHKNVIGGMLRRVRSEQDISQDNLALRCQLLGWNIARDTITRIEGGKRLVSDYELLILSKVLGITITSLFPDETDLSVFLETADESETHRPSFRSKAKRK